MGQGGEVARAYDRGVTTDPSEVAASAPDQPVPASADEGEPAGLDLDAVAAELDDVAVALERLEDGSYGTCEACGTALTDEVLAERPAARRCAEHAA